MSAVRPLWCCACARDVNARLTNGAEVYPHRPDLAGKPFWRCPDCRNYVGCHARSVNNAPLGNIPTPELRKARNHIHALLDPLWQSRGWPRGDIYRAISERVGWKYHTAYIRTIEDAREVYRVVRELGQGATLPPRRTMSTAAAPRERD